MTLLMTCLSVTVCVKHSVVVLFSLFLFFFFFFFFSRYDLGQVRVFNVHIQNKLLYVAHACPGHGKIKGRGKKGVGPLHWGLQSV